MPAQEGAPTEVPPTIARLPPVYVIKPSWLADAANATSGTSLALSAGTPAPVCQAGLAKKPLAPPPLEARSRVVVSFQAVS